MNHRIVTTIFPDPTPFGCLGVMQLMFTYADGERQLAETKLYADKDHEVTAKIVRPGTTLDELEAIASAYQNYVSEVRKVEKDHAEKFDQVTSDERAVLVDSTGKSLVVSKVTRDTEGNFKSGYFTRDLKVEANDGVVRVVTSAGNTVASAPGNSYRITFVPKDLPGSDDDIIRWASKQTQIPTTGSNDEVVQPKARPRM